MLGNPKKLTLFSALLFTLTSCSNQDVTSTVNQKVGIDAWPTLTSPIQDAATEQQVEQLLARMTLEEKVGQIMQGEIQAVTAEDIKKYHLGSVLNGGGSMPNRIANAKAQDWLSLADELYLASMDTSDGKVAIPVIWGTDAVHGHNNVTGATIFPHNIGLGATNNPDLIRQIGAATAREVRATGIEWVFAPTLAVAQNDFWGRTYESYAEDPQRVREYATAMVEGLQGAVNSPAFLEEERVVATAKHFLADGGTFGGDDQGDARIGEQELIDIHNPGYPAALEAGVQSVMASFSAWNGEKMHGNPYLLTDVLKNRMGFDGFVVGDWNGHGQVPGCTNDSCAQAINAGIDLVMVPYDWKAMYANTLAQVKAGEISEARLDDAVRRILRVKVRAGLFDKKPSERALAGQQDMIGHPEHRTIARQAVRESLVLLKNHNRVLPIKPQQTVLVTGDGADNIGKQSGGWSVSWQGTGNTNDSFPGATSIYAGIKAAVEDAGGKAVLSADGSFSAKPDVAVVVFGEEPYAEGQGDLDTLEFEPGSKTSLALLKSLKAQGIPVVSVFLSGRPMWVNPELNASDAFVAAWLPGTEGAGVADVLIANADGSPNHDFKGKLSFSWPRLPLQAQLNPHHPHYDPLFAYGYGLTYAAGEAGPKNLPEKVAGVATGKTADINFYVGRPLQPWNVFISSPQRNQILSGAYAALPDNKVAVKTSDKDVQEDALTFTWRDLFGAGLMLEGGKPLDLREYLADGVLSLDLNVIEFDQGGLAFRLRCGDDCERKVPFTEQAFAMAGKGWQNVRLSLSCFVHDGDDFSKVTLPFALEAGGRGELAVANVRILKKGTPNASCPDYKTVAVTPSMLNEFWARSWWEPRHKEKLQRIQQGNVDLLMIGDSITQGWENEGKAAWEKFYAGRNAVNLGYGGDRTENVLWRLQHGEVDGINPRVAVLMIGTNNTGHRLERPEFTANGIKTILQELRTRLPETKILLLGIFPRDEKPDAEMRQINNRINDIIKTYADNQHIFYLNINERFLAADGTLSREVMPDLLHLNESSYAVWAEAMEPTLVKLLQE